MKTHLKTIAVLLVIVLHIMGFMFLALNQPLIAVYILFGLIMVAALINLYDVIYKTFKDDSNN